MLQKDGYLEEDLAPYPVGLEECLTMKFGMNRWNGLHVLWIRDEDKSTKSEPMGMNYHHLLPFQLHCFSAADKKALKERHRRIKIALVEHFEYGTSKN